LLYGFSFLPVINVLVSPGNSQLLFPKHHLHSVMFLFPGALLLKIGNIVKQFPGSRLTRLYQENLERIQNFSGNVSFLFL